MHHDQRTAIRRTRSWTTKFGSFVTSVGALSNAIAGIVDGDAFPGCVTFELISTARSHCIDKRRSISIQRKSIHHVFFFNDFVNSNFTWFGCRRWRSSSGRISNRYGSNGLCCRSDFSDHDPVCVCLTSRLVIDLISS